MVIDWGSLEVERSKRSQIEAGGGEEHLRRHLGAVGSNLVEFIDYFGGVGGKRLYGGGNEGCVIDLG